ncbi:hypothetical protein E2562_009370 [Oryza meyeriana var. granulata]|uniref:Uncharacterized protein n=1 Tax=Oryza meyeriana var. granulata TaxID=110450 RepID=A0A6G1CDR8_9ORYZ|nr:hypothetical protein E2562_009370 [Oryza meyeriana var. granulata]
MAALINFLRVVPPREQQPVAPLPVAKSAIFVAINGLVYPSYLRLCLSCDDARGHCFREGADVEQMCYQMANFATAVLGVALLALHLASSSATVFPALAMWLVWITKVFTCGTLQFGLNIVHFRLRMIYFKLMRRSEF